MTGQRRLTLDEIENGARLLERAFRRLDAQLDALPRLASYIAPSGQRAQALADACVVLLTIYEGENPVQWADYEGAAPAAILE